MAKKLGLGVRVRIADTTDTSYVPGDYEIVGVDCNDLDRPWFARKNNSPASVWLAPDGRFAYGSEERVEILED